MEGKPSRSDPPAELRKRPPDESARPPRARDSRARGSEQRAENGERAAGANGAMDEDERARARRPGADRRWVTAVSKTGGDAPRRNLGSAPEIRCLVPKTEAVNGVTLSTGLAQLRAMSQRKGKPARTRPSPCAAAKCSRRRRSFGSERVRCLVTLRSLVRGILAPTVRPRRPGNVNPARPEREQR